MHWCIKRSYFRFSIKRNITGWEISKANDYVYSISRWIIFKVSCVATMLRNCLSMHFKSTWILNFFFILFSFRMLKCLIIPLLFTSITCAIGSLNLAMSGKIAKRWVVFVTEVHFRSMNICHTCLAHIKCVSSFSAYAYEHLKRMINCELEHKSATSDCN